MIMLILIPVVDKVNFMPAVRHTIREFMSGERMEVHLLHVRSPFFLSAAAYLKGKKQDAFHRETADKTLQPARALLERFHIPYTVHLESGDRARAIDAVARRLKVDRIVLGTARPWSATRLAEDAVVQKVLDRAPAPVSIVAGKSVSRLERYGVAAGLGATLWLILFG
jgi:nucleotide-binding universal stress UspA family protein